MAKTEIQISPGERDGDVSRVENAHLSWMSHRTHLRPEVRYAFLLGIFRAMTIN